MAFDFDRPVADVARNQLGLCTRSNIFGVGGTADQINHRLSAGLLEVRAPGVYAVRAWPRSADQQLLANVLSAPGLAAVSHLAAARRFGLDGYRTADPEMSVPRGTRISRAGVRIHESTDLHLCRIEDADGVPTTDIGRTLLDLGRYVGVGRLTRNVENARRLGLLDWSQLVRTLVVHARRGRPGIRKLRAVIDAEAANRPITDSELEMLVLSLLREAALPEPEVHHEVWDHDRFVAEVDLAYPDRMIAIECDGDIHLQPAVRNRDLPRQNDLMLVGWLVLRYTANDYRNRPQHIVNEVRAALRRRAPVAARHTG